MLNKQYTRQRPLVLIAHGYSHQFWGSERVALDCGRAYRDSGFEVRFMLPVPGIFSSRITEDGFDIVFIETCGRTRGPLLENMMRVGSILTRLRPALIHSTSLGPVASLVFLAKIMRIPFVAQLQTIYSARDMVSGHLPWADLVLPVSQYTSQPATKLFRMLPSNTQKQIQVLEPPICGPDPQTPNRSKVIRQQWGLTQDEIAVGMIGQLIKRKGVDLFLRACSEIRVPGKTVRVILVGETPKGSQKFGMEIKNLVKKLGMDKKLIQTGFVSDVSAYHGALDILAMPSREEGLGLVAGEAMRGGSAVVAAEVGGLPEIVSNGKTGLLFPKGDVASLKQSLEKLVENPELRKNLAKAGENNVRRRFSRSCFTEKLNNQILPIISQ